MCHRVFACVDEAGVAPMSGLLFVWLPAAAPAVISLLCFEGTNPP
jgi:hypothetical protein